MIETVFNTNWVGFDPSNENWENKDFLRTIGHKDKSLRTRTRTRTNIPGLCNTSLSVVCYRGPKNRLKKTNVEPDDK